MTNPPRVVGRVSPPGAPPHSPARTFHPRLRPTRVAQATRLSRSATCRPERNQMPYCLRQIAAFIVYRPSMLPRLHDQKIHPMTNPPRPVGRVSPPGAPPHWKIHPLTYPPSAFPDQTSPYRRRLRIRVIYIVSIKAHDDADGGETIHSVGQLTSTRESEYLWATSPRKRIRKKPTRRSPRAAALPPRSRPWWPANRPPARKSSRSS